MKVLMCTDNSKFSEQALEYGGKLLQGAELQVTVLYVIPRTKDIFEHYVVVSEEDYKRKMADVSAVVFDKARKVLKKHGIDPMTETREGMAADEILKEAREGDYDLIVVGSHGASGVTGYMMGSVSSKVVQHAEAPVLVVRGRR
ncbi:MAG: universal stress protein [Euryarchaeota archaeon]|nr:universal stress protein [Euryarchaeota archaeon]